MSDEMHKHVRSVPPPHALHTHVATLAASSGVPWWTAARALIAAAPENSRPAMTVALTRARAAATAGTRTVDLP